MNKTQKRLVIVAVIIFLFVTLNPSWYWIKPSDFGVHYQGSKAYFSTRPMYHYWGIIAVPTTALYFLFKDKKDKS